MDCLPDSPQSIDISLEPALASIVHRGRFESLRVMEPEYGVEGRKRNKCHVPTNPANKGMESIMETFEVVVTTCITCVREGPIVLLHREKVVGSRPNSVNVKKL